MEKICAFNFVNGRHAAAQICVVLVDMLIDFGSDFFVNLGKALAHCSSYVGKFYINWSKEGWFSWRGFIWRSERAGWCWWSTRASRPRWTFWTFRKVSDPQSRISKKIKLCNSFDFYICKIFRLFNYTSYSCNMGISGSLAIFNLFKSW